MVVPLSIGHGMEFSEIIARVLAELGTRGQGLFVAVRQRMLGADPGHPENLEKT